MLCVEIFIKYKEMLMQASFTTLDLVEAQIITQANFQKIEERKKRTKTWGGGGGGGGKHLSALFLVGSFSCRKFLYIYIEIIFLLEIFFESQCNYLTIPVDTRWPVLWHMM